MDKIQSQHQGSIYNEDRVCFECSCGWKSLHQVLKDGPVVTKSDTDFMYQEWLEHMKSVGTSIFGDLLTAESTTAGGNLLYPDISVNDVAHVCHDANRAICRLAGDNSQPIWEDAPDWQRESAVKGVVAIRNNPKITATQLHNEWSDAKFADGWKYGPVKDVDKKEHPCLVPYADLGWDQQSKDIVFRAIVIALFQSMGYPTDEYK